MKSCRISFKLITLHMCRLSALFFLSVSCAGCATDSAILLQWDVHATSTYSITKTVLPGDIPVDVDALLENPNLLKSKINELKSVSLDPSAFSMHLQMIPDQHGNIDVLAKIIQTEQTSPAGGMDAQHSQNLQQRMAGLVQLNTSINQYGKNLNNFLKQQQYNLVSQLFEFPEHPVAIGEKWRLPVILTSLNTPFLADKTRRVNRVWVNSITEQPGLGKIAEIVYLIEEKIDGNRQQLTTDAPSPFSAASSYFAVGEFQIEAHRWLRYVGRLETSVASVRDVSLIGLVPSNKGAP